MHSTGLTEFRKSSSILNALKCKGFFSMFHVSPLDSIMLSLWDLMTNYNETCSIRVCVSSTQFCWTVVQLARIWLLAQLCLSPFTMGLSINSERRPHCSAAQVGSQPIVKLLSSFHHSKWIDWLANYSLDKCLYRLLNQKPYLEIPMHIRAIIHKCDTFKIWIQILSNEQNLLKQIAC